MAAVMSVVRPVTGVSRAESVEELVAAVESGELTKAAGNSVSGGRTPERCSYSS